MVELSKAKTEPDDPPAKAFDRYLAQYEPDLPERYRNPGRPRLKATHRERAIAAGILAVLVVGALALWIVAARAAGCAIKGNISRSGERIYHPPCSPAYGSVVIDPAKGERMFCSESEARAAGWRPAKGRDGAVRGKSVANPFE